MVVAAAVVGGDQVFFFLMLRTLPTEDPPSPGFPRRPSDVAHEMLGRLPAAKAEDVPVGAPEVTAHTRAFRELRAKLMVRTDLGRPWAQRGRQAAASPTAIWGRALTSRCTTACPRNLLAARPQPPAPVQRPRPWPWDLGPWERP